MTLPADAILAVLEGGRGTRPYSLQYRETEQVLNVALALLVELSASNDRIDRLERLLAESRGVPVSALRETVFDEQAAAERQAALDALHVRVLRVFLDPREASDGHPDAR